MQHYYGITRCTLHSQLGWGYFRLHPKGRGIVCTRPGGIAPFTFVEEYLGELHSPWRWFEMQVGPAFLFPCVSWRHSLRVVVVQGLWWRFENRDRQLVLMNS